MWLVGLRSSFYFYNDKNESLGCPNKRICEVKNMVLLIIMVSTSLQPLFDRGSCVSMQPTLSCHTLNKRRLSSFSLAETLPSLWGASNGTMHPIILRHYYYCTNGVQVFCVEQLNEIVSWDLFFLSSEECQRLHENPRSGERFYKYHQARRFPRLEV